jgi:hypothetical protein
VRRRVPAHPHPGRRIPAEGDEGSPRICAAARCGVSPRWRRLRALDRRLAAGAGE